MIRSSRYTIALIGLFFHQSSDAYRIETPWGEINSNSVDVLSIVLNPIGQINPTGLPTQGDLVQVIAQDPEAIAELVSDPRVLPYLPVASAMVAGRNAAIVNGARPIPANIRAILKPFYTDEILDSVRWTTNWNAVQNTLQAFQMFRDHRTGAITLLNAIVFRDADAANDISVWAHELYHVQQYKDWGVRGFAERWTNNSSVTGPVEQPAYSQQSQIMELLRPQLGSPTVPVATAADCRQINAGNARCVLYAASSGTPMQFTIAGTARATSDGTRNGRMKFALITEGQLCNSNAGTEYMVDNATELSGVGFVCITAVMPGQTKTVFLTAPNSRADAVFTTASATWNGPQFVR